MASNLNLSLILRMVDNASAPLRQFSNRIEAMHAPVQRLGGEFRRAMAVGGINRMSVGIRGIGREMLSLSKTAAFTGAAVAGMGALFVKSQLLDTAAQFEKFEAILTTLEGSSAKAKQSMAWISDFAATTPFEFEEVTDAFVKLRSYGLNPTNGLMKTLGDTAAAMGKPISQAVEAIADAVTGENERLKELGITASVAGKKTVYSFVQDGKTISRTVNNRNKAMIQSTLEAIWNEKYRGSMAEQAKTWDGMMSNLSDQWTRVKVNIMKAGLFDWLKGKLANLLRLIDKMAADGSLEAWAQKVGKALKSGFEGAWQAAKSVHESIRELAELVGGFGNLAKIALGAVAAIMAGPLLLAITNVLAGLVMLSTTFYANPILLAVLAIGAAIALVALNWDTLTQSFLEGITAVASWLKSTLLGAVQAVLDGVMGIGRGIKSLLPTINAPAMGKAAPTLSGSGTRPGFMTPQARVDTGGTLNIKIDQDGKAKVTGLKTNDTRMNYNVDAGLTMAGAR